MPTIKADGTCVCGIAASDCDYHRPTTFEKRYGFTAEKWRDATQYVYRRHHALAGTALLQPTRVQRDRHVLESIPCHPAAPISHFPPPKLSDSIPDQIHPSESIVITITHINIPMHTDPSPSYDLRPCSLEDVRRLCVIHHGYGSAGSISAYSFAVYEPTGIVAAYAWQPPPPGAGAVCPEAPYGVLALSRMVAVPNGERELNHVSRPLKRQMLKLIDRTRWPVLLTYSDEGQGHTGHVYKCSGWERTKKNKRTFYLDDTGKRASSYANGKSGGRNLIRGGTTVIQRWEHWACVRGTADVFMWANGWRRNPIPGKFWSNGSQAHEIVKERS